MSVTKGFVSSVILFHKFTSYIKDTKRVTEWTLNAFHQCLKEKNAGEAQVNLSKIHLQSY